MPCQIGVRAHCLALKGIAMTAAAFDTLKAAKILINAGVDPK